MKNTQQRGVTLVEIAIVLVVIGLLLGGVLKGSELINNAKVRAVAEQQNSLVVAWYAFVDRFNHMPGDYPLANEFIANAVGSGTITTIGDGQITEMESPLVFQNLAGAGYLICEGCTAVTVAAPAAANSPVNIYGGIISAAHDNANYARLGAAAEDHANLLQIRTGALVPSNVLAEVDRKIDDGIANTGDFVFSQADNDAAAAPVAPAVAECTSIDDAAQMPGVLEQPARLFWRNANASPPVRANCGAATII